MPDIKAHSSVEPPDARDVPKAIDLFGSVRHPVLRKFLSLVEYPIEKTLSIDALNNIYKRSILERKNDDFFKDCIDVMNINYAVSSEDSRKIPDKGPLVVVANHPFGGIEGVILTAIMDSVRSDVKIMGNYLLKRVPEVGRRVIAVDPFGRKDSAVYNRKGLREAIQWVKKGGALLTFPAGEVSHFHWRQCKVDDSAWSSHVGAIIRYAEANVLPVYLPGRNSLMFQIMGLLHPKIRTALIPREIVNMQSKTVKVYIGKPISWKKLDTFKTHKDLIEYLQINTCFMQNRAGRKPSRFPAVAMLRSKKVIEEEIIPSVPSSLLHNEIDALPESNQLVDTRKFAVYIAESTLIPECLREIGRLREITFREVKEGTGKSIDLDQFDSYYLHLFLWNKTAHELVGAYRLGLADVILRQYGQAGLYANTLFKFKRGFLQQLGDAIELGRSFIRSEYQKEYNCLALLWRGIGQFIIRNPRYNMLFGPVSISHDYHAVSKKLIVQFLRQYKSDSELSRYVSPRVPFRSWKGKAFIKQSFHSFVRDIDDISLLISEIEKNGRGVPILLRHYLKLNGTLLDFNVDKKFSHVVDGLMLVDLINTDIKLLKRFMGKKGLSVFARYNNMSIEPEITCFPERLGAEHEIEDTEAP